MNTGRHYALPEIKLPLLTGVLLAAIYQSSSHAAEPMNLGDFSLEDLSNVVVTSVSKKEEPKNAAAAAIYVLTGEEIRAHGARTLAEALRLVPGLSVARSDSTNWAVSARGFNSFLADKMEVVLDGRSLYTPLFSGVFWDAQSTYLDDIERIEVIRGPGAAVWGANAVNGVINIVTRSARDTQGTELNVGLGSEVKSHISSRHGGKIGETGHYRVYAQGSDFDATESPQGQDNSDDWNHEQAGFRSDWVLANSDDLTVQGDIYDGTLNSNSDSGEVSGINLLSRWHRSLGDRSSISVQTYFDHTERNISNQFNEKRDQVDLEFVHNFRYGDRHDIVWGAGYRRSSDDIKSFPGSGVSFDPASRTLETLSLFVQDQIALSDNTELTLGTKIEENDFTGTEVQPTIRIAWSPDALHTLWGSLSRAVRTPNRLDQNISIQGFAGSSDFESEVAISAETGYRFPLGENTSVDVAVFYTDYDKLRAVANSGAPPFMVDNLGEGSTWGLESSALWIPNSRTRLLFSYRYLDVDLEFPPTSFNGQLNADPSHETFVRGTYVLRDNLELSAMLRYVDELPGDSTGIPGTDNGVPAYTELNLGIRHQITPNLEWSVHGENLLNSSHREFGNNSAIERSVFTYLKWRF